MARFYALINDTGIQEVVATAIPGIEEIQKLVGIPGEDTFFEAVYQCYSDKSIALLVDDDFLRKAQQPTLITPQRVILQGQIIVLAIDAQQEDFCLLTKQQLELVKKETKLFQKPKV